MNIRNIHYIILGFINEEPMHGYQIYKYLTDPQGIGLVWKIKVTNIYGLMDVLEKNELIEAVEPPPTNREYPPKKYFGITPTGKEQFDTWLKTPVKHGREIRQVFLAKVYFSQKQGTQAFQDLLDDQINECKKWLENINKPSLEGQEFNRIVRSYRTMQIENTIAWLQRWKS
jgi:DNA-binding PadR family transcriptional regulator